SSCSAGSRGRRAPPGPASSRRGRDDIAARAAGAAAAEPALPPRRAAPLLPRRAAPSSAAASAAPAPRPGFPPARPGLRLPIGRPGGLLAALPELAPAAPGPRGRGAGAGARPLAAAPSGAQRRGVGTREPTESGQNPGCGLRKGGSEAKAGMKLLQKEVVRRLQKGETRKSRGKLKELFISYSSAFTTQNFPLHRYRIHPCAMRPRNRKKRAQKPVSPAPLPRKAPPTSGEGRVLSQRRRGRGSQIDEPATRSRSAQQKFDFTRGPLRKRFVRPPPASSGLQSPEGAAAQVVTCAVAFVVKCYDNRAKMAWTLGPWQELSEDSCAKRVRRKVGQDSPDPASARDWWSTVLGEKEEFDQGCLCLADVDNTGNGLDKIIVGSFSGYLRIFNPHPVKTGDGAQAEDLLLEVHLRDPILQVEVGKFVSRFFLADSRTLGNVEHGNQYQIKLMYEHNLQRTACNMTYGAFGGV
ncbi:Protein PTHB1, partial [Galemys pyrenaicus]